MTRVFTSAATRGAVLHISDTWNLPRCGRTSSNDGNMLDSIRPFVESGRLLLLAEASPDVLRAMQRVPGFVRLFQVVDVAPLADDKVDAAIRRAVERRRAGDAENVVDAPSRSSLVYPHFLLQQPASGVD